MRARPMAHFIKSVSRASSVPPAVVTRRLAQRSVQHPVPQHGGILTQKLARRTSIEIKRNQAKSSKIKPMRPLIGAGAAASSGAGRGGIGAGFYL